MWTNHAASPGKQSLVAMGLIVAPMLLTTFGAAALAQARVIPDAAPGFMAMGAFVLGGIGYWTWYARGVRRGRAHANTARGATVTCPQCGAANALAAGQALERCRFCGAMLVASATVMRDVVAEAVTIARRARIERYRAERSGMAMYSGGMSAGNWGIIIIPGSYLGLLGSVAVVVSLDMAFGSSRFNPSVFFLWALVLVGAGVIALLWANRRAKKRAWQGALDALARPLGGCCLDDVRAMVTWLNTYWVGPIDVRSFAIGPYFQSAAGVAAGFPFLVWADPVAASSHQEPRVQLYIAACFHGAFGAPPIGAHGSDAQLSQMGFSYAANPAGIIVSASKDVRKRLHRAPDARPLIDAVWCTAHLARALGASPAEPLPP
jgi:protein-S-isoprenylcysteine O-methyltransferase Ste14